MAAILVTGAREWNNVPGVKYILESYRDLRPILIEGECRGADLECKQVALELGWEVLGKPADWSISRGGGVVRNTQMVKELLELQEAGMQVCVWAFHGDITKSRGTKDCINKALKS